MNKKGVDTKILWKVVYLIVLLFLIVGGFLIVRTFSTSVSNFLGIAQVEELCKTTERSASEYESMIKKAVQLNEGQEVKRLGEEFENCFPSRFEKFKEKNKNMFEG